MKEFTIVQCTHTVSYVFNYNRKIIDKRRLYTVHFMYNISPKIIYCIQFSKYRTCNIPPAPPTAYQSSNMSTNRKVKKKETPTPQKNSERRRSRRLLSKEPLEYCRQEKDNPATHSHKKTSIIPST